MYLHVLLVVLLLLFLQGWSLCLIQCAVLRFMFCIKFYYIAESAVRAARPIFIKNGLINMTNIVFEQASFLSCHHSQRLARKWWAFISRYHHLCLSDLTDLKYLLMRKPWKLLRFTQDHWKFRNTRWRLLFLSSFCFLEFMGSVHHIAAAGFKTSESVCLP